MHILLIEDDLRLAQYLAERLAAQGAAVAHAASLAQAGVAVASDRHEVYIVDRTLPDGDGQEWLEEQRRAGDSTPALFLTALGSVADKVAGLRVADDYIVKPFEFEELWARVQALLRRSQDSAWSETITVGNLHINRLQRSVSRGEVAIALMPMEYKLLDYLLANRGQVVTRSMLLESVWGFNFEPSTNIVQTYISRLRAKIDEPQATSMIETVRGEGYRFSAVTD